MFYNERDESDEDESIFIDDLKEVMFFKILILMMGKSFYYDLLN